MNMSELPLPRPGFSPGTLTQDQYEAKWKPAGWRLIVIGPTATWRQDWGTWEAIRDIVQNCLDEAEAYQYGYDEEGLWIADKGKGVAVADFLLGPPKLKPDYARGKFGEGMKIAALALLRMGFGVHVHTVRRELWIIFLEQKVNGKVQTLAAMWKPNGTAKGTRFHIVGYRGSAYSENFAVNIPRSAILAEVPSPITQPKQRYNQLLRPTTPAGSMIYARDIALYQINSPFSYNLWGFELAPDRHGPKEERELYEDMARLWAGVSNVALLKQLIPMLTDPPLWLYGRRETNETLRLQMDPWSLGINPITGKKWIEVMMDNRQLWQEAWNETVGKNKVIQTESRLNSLVRHLGYEPQTVQIGVRQALKMVILTDADVVREMSERLDEAKRIPDHDLDERQLANLMLARAMAIDFRGIGPVHAGIIPPASDMVTRTAGLYEYGTGMIKISVDMLDSVHKTIEVMVHEIGHHVAYKQTGSIEHSGDLTPGHARAMEDVAARIFKALHVGRYDDELQYVVW